MNLFRQRISAILTLLCLGYCISAAWFAPLVAHPAPELATEAPADAQKISEIPVPDTGNVFMWEAFSETGHVYLLGTIHVGTKSLYPMDKNIEDAFAASGLVCPEINMTPEVQMQSQQMIMKSGIYTDGNTLTSGLTLEESKAVDKGFEALGLPEMQIAQMKMFKPWMLQLALLMQDLQGLGFNPADGIDLHFLERAAKEGKKIMDLETIQQQLDLLSGRPDKEQIANLLMYFETRNELSDQINKMFECWSKGNADVLYRLTVADVLKEYPALKDFYKSFVDDRNIAMAKKIQEILKLEKKTTFVLVGSLHLIGEKGVVNLLRQAGYKVTPVKRTGALKVTKPAELQEVQKSGND